MAWVIGVIVIISLVSFVSSVGDYRPYLHNSISPESPKMGGYSGFGVIL